ncbi:fork head domain-containing protein, partial [Radiomyces spectabilis]|uniref:fork head domain-containing protein n=1 Tax=Radiomyces spectabilis TaxID=64574 RepID=UPI00221F0F11
MAASCPILPSFTFVIDGGIRRKRIGKKSTSSTVPSRTSAKKPDPSPVKEKSGQGPLDSASPNRSKHNQLNIVPSWLPTHRCEKPPYSYATMIAHAILSSTDKRLTLGEIYHWIADRYPFYKLGEQGWQNSIRHNLSLHKAFVKLHRPAAPTSVAGKGNFWTLREEFE